MHLNLICSLTTWILTLTPFVGCLVLVHFSQFSISCPLSVAEALNFYGSWFVLQNFNFWQVTLQHILFLFPFSCFQWPLLWWHLCTSQVHIQLWHVGNALKVKKWRCVTDEPFPHVCAWPLSTLWVGFWCSESNVFTLTWHLLRSLKVWMQRRVWERLRQQCPLSVDERGICVAGCLVPAHAWLHWSFFLCRLGHCSALSSSCVTFPQHWQKRHGSSFFPDCGKFCLTDSSMWVYF